MYEELLRKIGLTENETKIYLALLEEGQSTSSKIVSKSKISGGKIYETLDKLHKKGLISVTKINGVKYFQTTNLKSLTNYIDEKKKELEEKETEIKKIIPSLSKLKAEEEISVNLLIGERSIKPLIIELLEKSKESFYAMGIRGSKKEHYNNFWWHITNEILEKKKKQAYYLFSENESEYFKKHKKLKFIEVKSIHNITPNAIDTIGDNLLMFSYGKELTCVHVKNKEIADSFKSFFLSLWKIAKS
jgi:sugar-specific transcriptional regulator TrmB